MITYTRTPAGLSPEQLAGFFVGWPSPPSPATHLRLLQQSDYVVLAMDSQAKRVVGFITAISDHVLSAYIPLLEVLPEHQGQGIGQELVRQMLDQLSGLYMVDLICDPDLQPFYERVRMHPASGMIYRNYARQSGEAE